MYAVLRLITDLEVCSSGLPAKLSNKDGIVGALPVFATRKQAERFAGNSYEIVELRVRPAGNVKETHAKPDNDPFGMEDW